MTYDRRHPRGQAVVLAAPALPMIKRLSCDQVNRGGGTTYMEAAQAENMVDAIVDLLEDRLDLARALYEMSKYLTTRSMPPMLEEWAAAIELARDVLTPRPI